MHILDCEHGCRLSLLAAVLEGLEIIQNSVGVGSHVGFERDFVFYYFGSVSPAFPC